MVSVPNSPVSPLLVSTRAYKYRLARGLRWRGAQAAFPPNLFREESGTLPISHWQLRMNLQVSTSLSGKTLFITGASRGIGLAIALRAARDGANIVIAAKTTEPHPKLPGHHLHRRRGGRGRRRQGPAAAGRHPRRGSRRRGGERRPWTKFGGIDILVNNASAINLTGTQATPMKRFDLMLGVNARGTFFCSQACLPHLQPARRAQPAHPQPVAAAQPGPAVVRARTWPTPWPSTA